MAVRTRFYQAPAGLEHISFVAKEEDGRTRTPHLALARKNTVFRIHPYYISRDGNGDYGEFLHIRREVVQWNRSSPVVSLASRYRPGYFQRVDHRMVSEMIFEDPTGRSTRVLGEPAIVPADHDTKEKPYLRGLRYGLHIGDGICLYVVGDQRFTLMVKFPPTWTPYLVP